MNLDQIEQQLNDQAADLRATDARLESQLERLLAEMEAEAGAGTPKSAPMRGKSMRVWELVYYPNQKRV